MIEQSTHPINIEGLHDESGPWQHTETTWSFDPARHRIVGWQHVPHAIDHLPNAENSSGSPTSGPQEITPESQATIIERSTYGKRAFHTLHEWEGVVEGMETDGFRCRITPIAHGGSDPTKVELTEFAFDDLATEADRSLVVPGAIFYWTIGRSLNAAGTVTNLSLVRFRRLPSLTPEQAAQADQEAEVLLRALDGRDGSSSTGS